MRREREFKTIISEEKYAEVLVRYQARETVLQVNYYFDTENSELLDAGICLRVREKNGAYELTFKTGKLKLGNVHLRNEYNQTITAEEFNKYITGGMPLSFIALGGFSGNEQPDAFPIRFTGKVVTQRSVIGLPDGSVIELDKNAYAGKTDYELEYEYDSKAEPPAFTAFLSENGVGRGVSESKQARMLKRGVCSDDKENSRQQHSTAIEAAKRKIEEGSASLVIIKNGGIIAERNGRGVRLLLDIYDDERELLRDALVVDKIVGKAAAVIMSAGGAHSVYGVVISRPALAWLNARGIEAGYGTLTDTILSLSGGVCPIEQSVLHIEDGEEALPAIRERLSELKKNKKEKER